MSRSAVAVLILLAACKQGEKKEEKREDRREEKREAPPPSQTAFYASTFEKQPTAAQLTELGRLAFSDRSLSASGRLACATCHDPKSAYAPGNDLAVQQGGADGSSVGPRAAPSLRYLQRVPRFTEHFHDSEGDGTDQGPTGGYTWDGRAQTAHDQARLPLYSPLEMANRDRAELAGRLRRAPYATRFRDAFGATALDDDAAAEKALLLALEVFQQDPAEFAPYDSKYDAVLRRTAKLDAAEARGFALFVNPKKGNCASCHPSTAESGLPVFTDFGFAALGVPRNRALAGNTDPAFFDLGLCGPFRTDLAAHPEYCGMFRVPSLRNTARRRRFMHNGVFTSLEQVVRFYATRDSNPERWYPGGAKQGDLPPQHRKNVNIEPPFCAERCKPALTDAEIADLVAFLKTLDDGYRP
jgi:cytochrome c peroxidase